MIHLVSTGSFPKTLTWLHKMKEGQIFRELDRYGRQGVNALSSATPRATGATAGSWTYTVFRRPGHTGISWNNTNRNQGVKIAIILQYGHGTGTGGYVAGRDYINPAIRPIFDQIASDVWKKVTDG